MNTKATPWRPPSVSPVDAYGVEARAASFTKRSIKNEAKRWALEMTVKMMDLTTLEGMDTPGRVRELCRKARTPAPGFDFPSVAAVCVYPPMIATAKQELEGTGINVAAVATYFPSGHATLAERLEEVKRAVGDGADEIDMVIRRGDFLAGEYQKTFDEVAATRQACGDAHLKVILETGELGTYDKVALASQIAIDAGAHFIKTSTGKVSPAATLPVTLVMLQIIRSHYLRTGEKIGMKPAGGIRTSKQALQYLTMVKETLGDAWLTPDLFRFGASSLLNDVLLQLTRLETGGYPSPRELTSG